MSSASAAASAPAASTSSTSSVPAASNAGTHEGPTGINSHYTSTGVSVIWKAPVSADGLTGYNVEISVNRGAWKLVSTLPASQLSMDFTKSDTSGMTQFRVSAVYSDGAVVIGTNVLGKDVFGLPGIYA